MAGMTVQRATKRRWTQQLLREAVRRCYLAISAADISLVSAAGDRRNPSNCNALNDGARPNSAPKQRISRKPYGCKFPVLTAMTRRGGSVADRDRAAHPQPQHLAGAAAIDRDLGEPVRVDVPEGFARQHRRESGGRRDRPAAHGKPRPGWDQRPPQPGQRVAVMVDIDDLGEVV